MTTSSASTSTDVKPKVSANEERIASTIATTVVGAISDNKEEGGKTPIPDAYKGDHKDTRWFLLNLKLYFQMHPMKANTDKKKMLLLSLLRGQTKQWKIAEQLKLFPEDKDNKGTKKTAKETWGSFKKRFKTDWQPIDVAGEAQMKIEDLQMKERVDDYVNKFHLLALETGYDNNMLIKFFREGLPGSL
ncbi:hypothetical protein Moror_14427 [Moniliophthora roreri MCA 2997]|uniref:Retrotransposon gag domain-containing protein n=2 Tax=Moniliophthora roreri TaxID=221103 RepID=V2WI35_MONRO|nr:hypothetical protein Moror_14427 [Moniliophthora roreri MCA 2997]KAI3616239.1 hypothetical protein WG66_013833 [Moniliophthora roreri]